MTRTRHVLAWIAALHVSLSAGGASAYSYSAAGAEPLIDAREATLAALAKNDFAAAKTATDKAQAELEYLDTTYKLRLRQAMNDALTSRNAKAVERVYLSGFAAEIRRRLGAASKEIKDYQQAKILVVKAKRFYDLLAPSLAEPARKKGADALQGCLDAIGNPGVFGVGERPADPAAFKKSFDVIQKTLESF